MNINKRPGRVLMYVHSELARPFCLVSRRLDSLSVASPMPCFHSLLWVDKQVFKDIYFPN